MYGKHLARYNLKAQMCEQTNIDKSNVVSIPKRTLLGPGPGSQSRARPWVLLGIADLCVYPVVSYMRVSTLYSARFCRLGVVAGGLNIFGLTVDRQHHDTHPKITRRQ